MNLLNILYYSQVPIEPANHGNRVRIREFARILQSEGHAIHFALINSYRFNKYNLKNMCNAFNSVNVIPRKKWFISFGKVKFDRWYWKGLGEHIASLCEKYNIDLIICSYVFQSKLLEYVPNHILKVIDTHDKMANRSQMMHLNNLSSLGEFSCTLEEERAYLRRADLVIGITEKESQYFEEISGNNNVVTISHTIPPQFLQRIPSSVHHIGIVASSNRFNFAMIKKCLAVIDEHLQARTCPFVIHIVGDIKKQVAMRWMDPKRKFFKKNWVKMHGFVADISLIYAQMDLIISPMTCGTGINIKIVEAMAYGLPVLTTTHGGNGIGSQDKMHQHKDIEALVASLFKINDEACELERLTLLSREKYLQFYEKNQQNIKKILNHPKLCKAKQSLLNI